MSSQCLRVFLHTDNMEDTVTSNTRTGTTPHVHDQQHDVDRVAVAAQALRDKYDDRCRTLEDDHLDQAIEQEVMCILHYMYHPCCRSVSSVAQSATELFL